MAPSKSQSFLKPSLSQLLMRSFDTLEDPKYATVPQSHNDEMRPSILERYQQCEEKHLDLRERCAMMGCGSRTSLEHTSSQSNYVPHPLALRTLNWTIEPLWRFCASKIHLQVEHGARQICTENNVPRREQKSSTPKKCFSQTPITSRQAEKPQLKSSKNAASIKTPTDHHALHIHCSQPAFEVLPPLFESRTHTLLYQNSYLLDGVKYDYGLGKNREQSVSAKLRLNYLQFLKSVNEKTKPTDCEVIFGDAKVILNPPPHWEGSRIDWLIKLEQQQEARKRKAEDSQQPKKSKDKTKNTKASAFKFHLKTKHKNKNEQDGECKIKNKQKGKNKKCKNGGDLRV